MRKCWPSKGLRPDPTREKYPYNRLIKTAMAVISNFCTPLLLSCMTETTQDERASGSSPEAGHKLEENTPIETTDQLRIAIDQGRGGKVDATDPAAAPLGTDDEAGGASNSAAQVRLAAAHEIKVRPGKRQRASGIGPAWWLIGFAVFMAASIVASVFWMIL
jgi:hypothetical protein